MTHSPELVELVVSLIDDHRPVFDEQGHISGTVPGRGAWECTCGISGTYDEVVLHAARAILDALKAGRYAVVKLPESDSVDDDGQVFFGEYDIRADCTGSPAYRSVTADFGMGLEFKVSWSPASTRWWAEHLLAAAAVAEGEDNHA